MTGASLYGLGVYTLLVQLVRAGREVVIRDGFVVIL